MKPGWRTTEFWVTLGTTAWAIFGHALPAPVQGVVVAVASGAYAISRAITKARTPAPSPAPLLPR